MFSRFSTRAARLAAPRALIPACSNRWMSVQVVASGANARNPANGWAAVLGAAVAITFGAATALCHKDASVFELSTLDEMHEFQNTYSPEEAYKKAAALAATYHKDVQVMWRYARAAYNLSEDAATPKDAKKKYMEEAVKLIQEAERLDNSNSDCHRWHGIILSGYGKYQSSKEFIANTFVMRDHWKQAVILSPQDASAHHLLGRWSYDVAEMAWWKRKIATALFAEPPSSTFEEALDSFERAERISPGFWKMNQVMLGKTEAKLGRKDKAIDYLQAALKLPIRTAEDKEAQAEAEKALAALGVKVAK